MDSIAVLGSIGSHMYLSAVERECVVRIAVEHAAGVPVFVGTGAISTQEVLEHVCAAEAAGAAGLIVAPVSYQRLSDREVLGLFPQVAEVATVPIVGHDNTGTTGFTFSLELYAEVAALPGIASIKVPPTPAGLAAARASVDAIRVVIPADVTIGVSGDVSAGLGLAAGCDAWYSVIAGALPDAAIAMAREVAGVRGSAEVLSGGAITDAEQLGLQHPDSQDLAVADDVGPVGLALAPLLDLFGEFGSLRVWVLAAEGPRVRLEAAMAAGSQPIHALVRPLIERIGVEPDFQVREMLIWALVRHHVFEDAAVSADGTSSVLPLLLDALISQSPLARAKSLHILTKTSSPDIWDRVTTELLHDCDDEVARTAWQAAAKLRPVEECSRLAEELVHGPRQGDLDVMRGLARAFVQLGDPGRPVLNAALVSQESRARAHAEATVRLSDDPESTFWMERA